MKTSQSKTLFRIVGTFKSFHFYFKLYFIIFNYVYVCACVWVGACVQIDAHPLGLELQETERCPTSAGNQIWILCKCREGSSPQTISGQSFQMRKLAFKQGRGLGKYAAV